MTDWSRLSKLAGMLGSPHDGERVNAARLLEAALQREGLTFGDLSQRIASGGGSGYDPFRKTVVEKRAKPNPAWGLAQRIIDAAKPRLTHMERVFLNDIVKSCKMTGGDYDLTPKQAAWLVMLEKQYITSPQHKMRRTRTPRPIPDDMLNDIGLGDRPGTFKGPPEPKPMRRRYHTEPRDVDMPDARREYDSRLHSGSAARELDLDDDLPF